jgi:hypothetical protein
VRPDILLPVNFLCSRSEKFDEDDHAKLIRILKYLQGTQDLGMALKHEPSNSVDIGVFADASFAVHPTDRKSHSGLCIKTGSSTVLCKSGKQSLVTTSSTKAELVACADAIPYVEGVRKLLELNFPVGSTVIHQDNLSTIKLINNKKRSRRRPFTSTTNIFFSEKRINSVPSRLLTLQQQKCWLISSRSRSMASSPSTSVTKSSTLEALLLHLSSLFPFSLLLLYSSLLLDSPPTLPSHPELRWKTHHRERCVPPLYLVSDVSSSLCQAVTRSSPHLTFWWSPHLTFSYPSR